MLHYLFYELNHSAMSPARAAADATRLFFENPMNPLSKTVYGRSMAAACELFERTTRRYMKPAFDIETVLIDGERVAVEEEIVWRRPFCEVIRFKRLTATPRRDPRLLIVAPLSGHYATLLRGTVETMLPNHDVYVTDWTDARHVPLAEGRFDLDDYIDYVMNIMRDLGGDMHVMAVCQPSVPVFAAAALMEEDEDPASPLSMTLMGGPIDTRRARTDVNRLAEERGTEWFRRNTIMKVPPPNLGMMREVYPGFLQLSGFMAMNLERHVSAHREFYMHLVRGDGDPAERHRDFYDEYLAVMDMSAEYYLQTVDSVFVRHLLPKGELTHRGRLVRAEAIRRVALMTVEGEKDDISGVGQTEAAHGLCVNLPEEMRVHYLQPNVGHYGVFNGSRFRSSIAPRISDFIRTHDRGPNRRHLDDGAASFAH